MNEAITARAGFILPPVVDYEIHRGLLYRPSPKKESVYRAFTDHYGVGDMTAAAWSRAAHIYAELQQRSISIGDADIFIASFCLANGCKLVTHNTRHFQRIDGLQMEDWSSR